MPIVYANVINHECSMHGKKVFFINIKIKNSVGIKKVFVSIPVERREG